MTDDPTPDPRAAATPILGIPYPLPADALTDYPTTGRQLAELVEALFTRLVQRTVIPGNMEGTAAGTYVTPAGAIALLVECIGGGGGGGGSAATGAGQVCGCSGGGGGGYASNLLRAPLDPSYAYGVGWGGIGGYGPDGAWGYDGGTTHFGNIEGRGGHPGVQGNRSYPSWVCGGGGGGEAAGEFMLVGGPGGNGMNIAGQPGPHIPVGGHGGNAARGGGGAPGNAGGGENGHPANIYGGGGSGAAGNPGEGARPGGAGAPGVLIVTAFLGALPLGDKMAPIEPEWIEYPRPEPKNWPEPE